MKTFIIWMVLLVALVGTVFFLLSQVTSIKSPFSKETELEIASTTNQINFDQSISYTCAGGNVVTTAYRIGDTNTLELSLPNSGPVIVVRTEAASGEKYSNSEGVVFWTKGDSALVEKNGAVIFADCKVNQTGSAEVPESDAVISKLSGTKWIWNETTYASGTKVTPEVPDDFVVTFSENGRFSANTDCNNLGGAYVEEGEAGIKFVDLVSTLMACTGEVKEAAFVDMLSKVETYTLEDSTLVLSLGETEAVGTMKFTKE